ncbi:hypothetical protein SB778_46340, partial [Paraburkholderia sp. SIMBA_050]
CSGVLRYCGLAGCSITVFISIVRQSVNGLHVPAGLGAREFRTVILWSGGLSERCDTVNVC